MSYQVLIFQKQLLIIDAILIFLFTPLFAIEWFDPLLKWCPSIHLAGISETVSVQPVDCNVISNLANFGGFYTQ